MTHHSRPYTIYLLTVWFDEGENTSNPASWRFRLENPRTKKAKGFVGIERLVQGLVNQIQQETHALQAKDSTEL